MDGLTSKITYDFLTELKRRGYLSSNLRIKYRPKDSNPRFASVYRSFKQLDSFLSNVSFVKERAYLCYTGDLLLIENMDIEVTTKNFSISFSCLNITESSVIKDILTFDNQRNQFYSSEIERIRAVLIDLIDKYKRNILNAINERINSYMDPCYVDAGYVSPNSN